MKKLKQQRRIKKAIALSGFICLGGTLPGVAQLPRFEEPRSPAPKAVSQPAPQPPIQPTPPAPQPPAPTPPQPVSPPSDAVSIPVPTPQPVSPPSDAVSIPVPTPQPVSPPSDAVSIPVPSPQPVSPPSDAVPIPVPTPQPVSPPPRPVRPSTPLPPGNNTTPPLPEQRQETVAQLAPANGFVSVKLINRTLATINYEIIGDTTLRTLPGKSEIILRGLMTPANVAFRRDDGGFLLVGATVNEQGILELNMTETSVFDLDRTTLSIEENGSVFLN